MNRPAVAVLLLLVFAVAVQAADRTPVHVDSWRVLDPAPVALPAFHDEDTGGVSLDDVLARTDLDPKSLAVAGWRVAEVGNEPLSLDAAPPATAWLATWIDVDTPVKPDLEITCAHPFKAWLNGKPVSLKEDEGVHTAELNLLPGRHTLALRTLRSPDEESPWTMDAALVLEADVPTLAFRPTTDPTRGVDIHDVLDYTRLSSVDLSPDGKLVMVGLGEYDAGGDRETWRELRSTKDGKLVRSYRGRDLSGVQWHPTGDGFSFTTRDDGKTTVWFEDVETGAVHAVARGLEDFHGYAWNPDGRSIVHAYGVDAESDDRGVKRLESVEDRWPWWRNRSYLLETTTDGVTRRLTAGDESVGSWSFSPTGSHMLFSRRYPAPTERPYSRTEWFEMDMATLAVERILAEEERWLDSVDYGPDRDTLILTGSPSAFGGLGRDLPDGVTPNDYGGQLYVYDRAAAKAATLSRDFDPTVQQVVWHAPSKRVVARVLDKQFVRLATCTLDGEWTLLDSGMDVVGGWEVAYGANTIVATGTSVSTPLRLYALDTKGRKPRLLLDPGAARFEHVTHGRIEPFVATVTDGMELDGRVHYPRNYDPSRKYPVIVYYYGGTYPITRDFGGRYPKNVWTARDFFVYVPNPSGALGYGQEYAARHVNDWGRLTAPEVIEGTRAFLEAHPAADPDRVGCIGASYGGFLTEYLITQTDLFAAAISHAGISSISSYWAEGYWGYAYGARALANSFPWSDRELYVEQSPLFHADAITTPLLLLHGFDDTNVPKGESDGLYIALKMLGRDVEYVQVEGQDHHILDHGKRVLWNDTILAYFTWKLKGDGRWWSELYSD